MWLKTRPEILEGLSLSKRPGCLTLLKAFDISSVTALVAPYMLKALTILSVKIVKNPLNEKS